MGVGASIFLLALGAILSFAVSDSVNGVDLVVVGYILMGAGVIGLIWSLLLNAQHRSKRETVVEERRLEP